MAKKQPPIQIINYTPKKFCFLLPTTLKKILRIYPIPYKANFNYNRFKKKAPY